ncbi:MAG: type II toxin-antitoxin system HicB family antitoxin [Pyrinomonadaceae bacterium]
MKNVMKFDEYEAVISFDPETEMFRGEFVGLNGGADFYAESIKSLRKEGAISLRVFLEYAKEKGISARKQASGKLTLRLDPELHHKLSKLAKAKQISLNQVIVESLETTTG